MKIKCNDGIVRRFKIASDDFLYYERDNDGNGIGESKCLECGKTFGVHDTKILKPIWRKHICKLKP